MPEFVCETCGAKLHHPPSSDYHEDFVLPGITCVVHKFTTSPTIRIHNEFVKDTAAVPMSQVRESSVRSVGQKGTFIVSKWFARKRGWLQNA